MSSPPLFTAHDVPDLIAMLPTRFGFVPQESLCVIATSGPRHRMGFSMRIDLPEEGTIRAVADHAVGHLRRQGAEGAIVVAVSERPELAGEVVRCVERSLGSVLPVVSAWATAERYWTTFDDCEPEGEPYTVSPHHLALVQAIAAGQEILPDRAALERSYRPEVSARSRWMAHTVEAAFDEVERRLDAGPGTPVEVARADVEPVLEDALLGRTPGEGEVLRLAVWVHVGVVRDHAWTWVNAETAEDLLRLWAHVSRLAPPGFRADPLCLAAICSYVRGDGAQALVAVEEALRADPSHGLARLLLGLLENGVPPSEVEQVGARLRAHLPS